MDLIKTVIILLVIRFESSEAIDKNKACETIKATLLQCLIDENTLYFSQPSSFGGKTVEYTRFDTGALLVNCRPPHEGIDVERIPKVSLEVKNLEVRKCPLKNRYSSNENVLSRIKKNFNISESLQSLVINENRDNETFRLTSTFLEEFQNLKKLELTTNYFITFHENVFQTARTLKTLTMNMYDVIHLPRGIFEPLTKLETLMITNSGQMKTETSRTLNFTLHKCFNLKFFHMSSIRWPIRISDLLTYNSLLEEVKIVNNNILSLNEKVFHGSQQISNIDLSNNKIANLPRQIFFSQLELVLLNLSHNKITSLDNEILSKNKELESVNLSHNQLLVTKSILFENLKYLKYLNLANNKLTSINFILHIGYLESLSQLILSNNEISSIDSNLALTNLISLDLKNNHLTRIFVFKLWPMSLRNLSISLESNNLESIDFRNVDDFEKSDTYGCLFIDLDPLINCNCHTNSLHKFLTKSLESDPKIYEVIYISPNDIRCKRNDSTAPRMVRKIEGKDLLTCPLNLPHVDFCPDSCTCTRRPFDETLLFKCSNISRVPMLPRYKELTDINLNKIQIFISGNGIDHLPNKITDRIYNDVTEIHASYNHIKNLFKNNIPDHLEYLDLKFNRLHEVSTAVIALFANLKFLHLSENMWNCSQASTVKLIRFAKLRKDIVTDVNLIRCADSRFFLEIDVEVKCDGYVMLAVVLILTFVSIITIVFVYRLKKEAISEWIFLNDKHHILEFESSKEFDGVMIVANSDKTFGKYVTAKLMSEPHKFKIGMIMKNWAAADPIPKNVLKSIKSARRVIIILSEYFDENNWHKWNWFRINSRVIFVIKGKTNGNNIDISNQVTIKFNDPMFWDKLKYAMVIRNGRKITQHDIEMQPLNSVAHEYV